MLNKISNINNGVDFRKYKKFRHHERNGEGSYNSRENEHDTISISPALNFFDNSSWHLKNITKSSDEKVLMSFEIGEYDFGVVIDSSALHQISFLKFFVGKTVVGSIRSKKVQLEILVELTRFSRMNSYDNLNNLDILVDRIIRLNISGELTKTDKVIINELSDGIKEGLQKEFEAIACVVLSFIESYIQKKAELRKHDPPLLTNYMAINKIKIING